MQQCRAVLVTGKKHKEIWEFTKKNHLETLKDGEYFIFRWERTVRVSGRVCTAVEFARIAFSYFLRSELERAAGCYTYVSGIANM
jgi:hypothetical protein